MKKAFTFLLVVGAFLPVYLGAQQCTVGNFTTFANLGPGSFPVVTGSGITMNVSAPGVPTLGNTSYVCSGTTYACAANSWWPQSVAHVITVTFSAPVAKFSCIINGTNQGEVFTFGANAGTNTLSDYCSASFSTVAANQLIDNVAPAMGTLITINNSVGATSFTISHNGTGSGSRISFPTCVVPASPFGAGLTDFVADYRPDFQDVKLSWDTQNEQNLRGFEVQHSLDGEAWDVLGFVNGAGNSDVSLNYEHLHLRPVQGTNYYRLRLVDFDANYQFSEIQTINIAQPGDLATIFPNPTTGRFEIRANGRKGTLELTDALGREILKTPFESQAILNIGDQAPGMYWVKIMDQTQRTSIQRIVLQ